MKKIPFLLQNAWKYILYNRFSSMVLFCAITVGFLFPMMALNDVNALLWDARISRYEDASGITILKYLMPYKEESQMEEALKQAEESFETAGYVGMAQQLVYANGASYSATVAAISRDYLTVLPCELVEGSFFSEADYAKDGERTCLLQYTANLVRDGVKAGDRIEILGNSYTVRGIIRAPRAFGGVMVPYPFSEEVLSTGDDLNISYHIITYGHKGVVSIRFPDQLTSEREKGVKEEEAYYASVRKINQHRILRAGIIILFTVINMLILFLGMTVGERYSMAVRMALGISRKSLFLEVLFRNLLLMLPAFCASILLYPLLCLFVKSIDSRLRGDTLLQAGAGGAALITLITLAVLWFGFKKQGVASMLKRRTE